LREENSIRVVVVDNASEDGSADLVETNFPWATLVRSGTNLGYGSAVNLGLEGAETPWVAAANADVEVESGALTELLSAGTKYDCAAILAPRLVLPSGRTQESVYSFPRLSASLVAGVGITRLSPRIERWARPRGTPGRDQPSQIDWAMGAFLLIRRSAYDAVGGFDARQWMYAEDLDLCWRARVEGWQTIYVPLARVKHVGGAAATAAFGASTNTPEVLGAYYSWLLRRRGLLPMSLFAAINLVGAFLRIWIYAPAAILIKSVRQGRLPEAWSWLRLNIAALRKVCRL
jgi:GT2 family glycosyltransferase